MRLTDTAEDVLRSFTEKGEDWSEACLYCYDEAAHYAREEDAEGALVWADIAREIDAWAKSRRK